MLPWLFAACEYGNNVYRLTHERALKPHKIWEKGVCAQHARRHAVDPEADGVDNLRRNSAAKPPRAEAVHLWACLDRISERLVCTDRFLGRLRARRNKGLTSKSKQQ